MTFIPNIVDNVTISILFYFHYFSNIVNTNDHILEQILHIGIEKQIKMENIIHYCISVEIQHKLNASYILQGHMCHLQQCNFDYQYICNFHHVFLKFILMGLSAIWKKII